MTKRQMLNFNDTPQLAAGGSLVDGLKRQGCQALPGSYDYETYMALDENVIAQLKRAIQKSRTGFPEIVRV